MKVVNPAPSQLSLLIFITLFYFLNHLFVRCFISLLLHVVELSPIVLSMSDVYACLTAVRRFSYMCAFI